MLTFIVVLEKNSTKFLPLWLP